MKKFKTSAQVMTQAALDFAHHYHRYQCRKVTDSPYILHPLQVADRLGRWGIRKERHPETWSAAYLHDVIEDTDAASEEIKYLFGSKIQLLVMELTMRDRNPDESVEDYAQAKRAYLCLFSVHCVEALVIKISDRMCNVADYMFSDKRYAVKYWDKAAKLFEALFSRLGEIEDTYGSAARDAIVADHCEMARQIEILREST